MKKFILSLLAAVPLSLALALLSACPQPTLPGPNAPSPKSIQFNNLSANGQAGSAATSHLELQFDQDPEILALSDLELPGVEMLGLAGSGTSRTLSINPATLSEGQILTLKLKTSASYSFSPQERTVAVHQDTRLRVNFLDLSANGSSGSAPSTTLTLSFSADPGIVSLSDFSLTGANPISISGMGLTRSLQIEKPVVGDGETVTLQILRAAGFVAQPAQKSAIVRNDFRNTSNAGSFKYIPPGTFQWSSLTSDTATLSKGYWMATKELTRAQFKAVMGTDPSNTSHSPGPEYPVTSLSWYMAISLCNKLSLMEGLTPVYTVSGVDFSTLSFASIPTANNNDWNLVSANWSANGYRLPSEHEWLWAAIGANKASGYSGTGVVNAPYNKPFAGYASGRLMQDYVWYRDLCGGGSPSSPDYHARPVGTKLPNELGLYDMSGNMAEYLWDWVAVTPAGAYVDYHGPASSTGREYIGGNFTTSSASLVIHNAMGLSPQSPGLIGIRLVRN